MELFTKAAAKHFSKNPTHETANTILLISEEIQKVLELSVNPINGHVKDAETQTEEKEYDNDQDTNEYINIFYDIKYVLPKKFGENKTYFYLSNLPKGYWANNKCFDHDNGMDNGIVYCVLNQRFDFYNNAPPNVYRCWRAATILADTNGHVDIEDLKSRGYTDDDISPLFNDCFISDSAIRIALCQNKNIFKLNPYFW